MRQSREEINKLAKIIWNYHHLNHKLEKADLILVLGSHDIRVAEYAADLFLKGWAPRICFSGGIAHQDDLLATSWQSSEADVFAGAALKMGVPKDKMILEKRSKNTGENYIFSHELLKKKGYDPKTIIVVQKPFMARRAYAAFKKLWPSPNARVILASPNISFEKYPNRSIKKEDFINIMVGDLQRIRVYGRLGYQIKQRIPRKVWQAYKNLVSLGYNKHLIK